MMKIYADKKYQKYCMQKLKKLYKKERPEIQSVSKGIIANEYRKGFGVFDANGNFLKSSAQNHKGGKCQLIPKFDINDVPYVDENAIYLCHTGHNHFGHFLLEHINRAWCLLDKRLKDAKIVIVNEKNIDKLPNYVFELLGLLGVKKENIILLNKTTRFKNVYIPSPAFNMIAFYTDVFAEMYNRMAESVKDTKDVYDKIYVSRCALPLDRHTFGEEQVQKIFEKNGYKIVYPETMSLEQQISLIKNCKYLAGCAGTALHLALFMKKGGTVIQIKRNNLLEDNAPVQELVNRAKGLNSIFISASLEKVKTTHSTEMPQIIGVTEYMKEFFDKNGFVYDEQDLIVDDAETKSYQEILSKCLKQKTLGKWFKRRFIHFSSCLIPGRLARKNYRRYLTRVWVNKQ